MADDAKKKNGLIESFENIVPELPKKLDEKEFEIPSSFNSKKWSGKITGSKFFYDDYFEGEEIHHLDGQTIEEAEHQIATRLYQNNAEFISTIILKKMVDLERELFMGDI